LNVHAEYITMKTLMHYLRFDKKQFFDKHINLGTF